MEWVLISKEKGIKNIPEKDIYVIQKEGKNLKFLTRYGVYYQLVTLDAFYSWLKPDFVYLDSVNLSNIRHIQRVDPQSMRVFFNASQWTTLSKRGLQKAMDLSSHNHEQTSSTKRVKLKCADTGSIVTLDVCKEIYFIEIDRKRRMPVLHSPKGTYTQIITLKDMATCLEPTMFMKLDLVNICNVQNITGIDLEKCRINYNNRFFANIAKQKISEFLKIRKQNTQLTH